MRRENPFAEIDKKCLMKMRAGAEKSISPNRHHTVEVLGRTLVGMVTLISHQFGHPFGEDHGKRDASHQDSSGQASKGFHHLSPSVGTSRSKRPDSQSESNDGEDHGIPLGQGRLGLCEAK